MVTRYGPQSVANASGQQLYIAESSQCHCLSRCKYVGCAKKHHYPRDNERVPAYVLSTQHRPRRCFPSLSPSFLSLSLSLSLSLLLLTPYKISPLRRTVLSPPRSRHSSYVLPNARRSAKQVYRSPPGVTSNGFLNMLPIDGFGPTMEISAIDRTGLRTFVYRATCVFAGMTTPCNFSSENDLFARLESEFSLG